MNEYNHLNESISITYLNQVYSLVIKHFVVDVHNHLLKKIVDQILLDLMMPDKVVEQMISINALFQFVLLVHYKMKRKQKKK